MGRGFLLRDELFFSCLDIRKERAETPFERRADRLFMLGLVAISLAMALLAIADM